MEPIENMKQILIRGITAKCTITDHDPATRAINILDQKDAALRECLEVIHSLGEKEDKQ